MGLGPNCPGKDKCEYRACFEEYQRVDRDYERHLVQELAAARVRINKLEAEIANLHDHEETRDDGTKVRKDRWESGIRHIATILGRANKSFEIDELVEIVRERCSVKEKK